VRQNAVTLYVEDSEAESIPTVDLKDFAPPYLFVYGTLMRGEHNEQVMPSGAKFLGEASTKEGFALLNMGLPAMIRRAGAGVVRGEVYEVNEGILARLDRFEGHPDFYRRERVPLEGPVPEAWCYLRATPYSRAEAMPSPASWKERSVS